MNNPLEEARELLRLRKAATPGPFRLFKSSPKTTVHGGSWGGSDYAIAIQEGGSVADMELFSASHRMADCLAALLARCEGLEAAVKLAHDTLKGRDLYYAVIDMDSRQGLGEYLAAITQQAQPK